MENSLAAMRPEIVTEWSPRNLPLEPEDVSYGSKKVYWWSGRCGHEWEASVKARSQGEKCPICSGKRIIPGINDLANCPACAQRVVRSGYNDLATTDPELSLEWDYEKNGTLHSVPLHP